MIYLATKNGLVVAEYGGGGQVVQRGLEGRRITCVVARQGVVLAGTEDGVFRSDDGGRTWSEASEGLGQRYVRWLAFHPEVADLEFAGTEPAGIYHSHDGAGLWKEAPEVAELRDRYGWMLPYSPRAGCVRGFAFHGKRVYAAVEVGGVLRSDDRGENWRLAEGSDGHPDLQGPPEPKVYPDVHSIEVHPSSPDLVFAPTGGGFYRSADGGTTWQLLYDCYCRAVWVDPADPARIVLGPADGVDSNGRIEETHDGGKTWSMVSQGLQVPWRGHMVERFSRLGDDLLAVLSNGELFAAAGAATAGAPTPLAWQRILPEVRGVNAVAVDTGQ